MKILRLAPIALLAFSGLVTLRAQEGGAPPDEIITDFGIDEYIYVPKFTLRLGTRYLSGGKASFAGKGVVNSVVPPTDYTSPNLTRYYHDGTVFQDTRTIVDSDGFATPITPDGFTNSWSYNYTGQVAADGNMAFHGYSADITDPGTMNRKVQSSYGVEVVVSRDMTQLSKRLSWTLFAGVSLNQVNSKQTLDLPATITTITDYYTLNGQTPPAPPYLAPSSGSSSVTLADGTVSTVNTDTTTLLGSAPLGRITTVTSGIVTNRWHVRGGYFTFRAGPALTYAITEKLKATVSVGPALVFVGSTYTVDQIYVPDVGADVISTVDDTTEKFLPGYYADGSLEYDISDRAGAYAGAFYQGTGSYQQQVSTTTANYITKVDMASMQGFRMGMNFRF